MSNSVLDLFARCEFSLGETVQITDNTNIHGFGLIDNTLVYIQQNSSTYVFSIVWVNLVTGQSKTETLDAGVFPEDTIFSPTIGNNNGVIQFYLWNGVKPTLMTITQIGYSYEVISGASSNWVSYSSNWSNGVMTVYGFDYYYAFNGKTFTQLNPVGGYISHEYLGRGWFYVTNNAENACYLYNMNTKEVLDIPSGGSSPVFTGSFIDSNGNIIFGDETNAYSFNPQTLQIKIIPNGSSFSSILIGTTLSLGVKFGSAVHAQLYYQGQMYYNGLNNPSFTLNGPGTYIIANRSLFVVLGYTGITVTPYTFGLPFGNEKLLRHVRNFTPSGHYWPRHSGRFRV